MKRLILIMLAALLAGWCGAEPKDVYTPQFTNAPLGAVLAEYARVTGRVVLRAPELPEAEITTDGTGAFDKKEYLALLDRLLALHGVGMVPAGEKIFQAVRITEYGAEPRIIEIRHAPASHVKTLIEQYLPENAAIPAVEGAEAAERGLVQGNVRIVADDRTNILTLITRPENMSVFEKLIKVYDVETAPDMVVKIFRLEYAAAERVGRILNELVHPGNGASSRGEDPNRNRIGLLRSADIRITSDDYTRSVILMASRADMAALEAIIKDLDILQPGSSEKL